MPSMSLVLTFADTQTLGSDPSKHFDPHVLPKPVHVLTKTNKMAQLSLARQLVAANSMELCNVRKPGVQSV